MENNEKPLDDFDWEKSPETLAFFGETAEAVITPASTDKPQEEGKTKDIVIEGEEEEDDFFKAQIITRTPEETQTPPETEEKQEVDATVSSYVENLKIKGLLNFELEEGQELTDELAEQILEDSYELKAEEMAVKLLEEMPEDVQELNRFILKGGSLQEYLEKVLVNSNTNISDDFDLDIEANQERIIRENFKTEGYDSEDIDSLVESMKDSGRLKKVAETHYNKIKVQVEADKKKLLESRAAQAELDKKQRKEFKLGVTKLVQDDESFKELRLSTKDKLEIPAYVSEQSIKLKNGLSITQMQKDLVEALKDQRKVILLGKILKDDFNFDSFKVAAEDKTARTVRTNIRRSELQIPTKSAGTGSKNSLLNVAFKL